MYSPQLYELATAALLAPELGRHWPKRLARHLGVPVATARHWVYRRAPVARRGDIADAIIAECVRLTAVIAETRRVAEGMKHEAGRVMAGGMVSHNRPRSRRVG